MLEAVLASVLGDIWSPLTQKHLPCGHWQRHVDDIHILTKTVDNNAGIKRLKSESGALRQTLTSKL
jgi:hypothetical protein